MEASFPEKKDEPRIFNRAGAQPAVADAKSTEDKGETQKAVVTAIRNRERCNFETAWNIAKGERPELFN